MTDNYTGFIGQIWSQKINAGLDKTCAMLQCVNRDYQADADKGAEAINIISPEGISASAYTGSIANYGTLSTTPTQLKLNQKVCFGISVPDIAEAQSNVSIIDTVTEQAKKGIESAIDTYLFGLHTNTDSANQIGSTTSPASLNSGNVYSKFVSLAKLLKLSGAMSGPSIGNRAGWVVVHPDVEEKLLLCEQFIGASNAGDTTIREGAIGKIAGMDVFVSNNVGKNATTHVVLAGTSAAITYASQLTKIETIRAQSSFDSLVRGLYTFGGLVVNPGALATLTCKVMAE